jgi:hypothetical protein
MESRYFDLTRDQSTTGCVDERTWNDLEFPRIFAELDTTVTPIGSQVLFRQLRFYEQDPQSAARARETYEALRADQAMREGIQLALGSLRADSSATIADSLFGQPLRKLKYRAFIHAWSALSVLTLVSVLAFSLTPLAAIAVVAVNIAFFYGASMRVLSDVETLNKCLALLRVAEALARLPADPRIPHISALKARRTLRARIRRAFGLFAITQNPAMRNMGLGGWLNMLCLADLLAYSRTVDRMAMWRTELRQEFELVGALDAAIAMASFLERQPVYCTPEVADAATLDIADGSHPLLTQPVRNSLALQSASALISGSNMAGKTTFIKMVGVNIVLGRTVGICLASRATIPAAQVKACIRGEHSIESGKSRYFAEVERLLSFLTSPDIGATSILVIDEPFSGTNTVERIAAARSVLSALSRHSIVLATTHDVELQELLKDRFAVFHFAEEPELAGFFDFRLRPGPCTEGNAIRLLEKIGYPADVVMEALDFTRRKP